MAKYKFCTVALIECFRLDAVTCSHCVCDTADAAIELSEAIISPSSCGPSICDKKIGWPYLS